MKDKFEKIYSQNEWLCGSGEGSLPVHTKSYSAMLQAFLRKRKIRTVVDLGCGDWQSSQLLDWSNVAYQGFDIVRSVIENNRARFTSSNIQFHLYSGNPEELPGADLLIAKDVLQHWSNKAIREFLPKTRKYKYSLITNCVNPDGATTNRDIEDGQFRYLDLRLDPFEIAAKELLTFTNYRPPVVGMFSKPRWRKIVLLIEELRTLTDITETGL